MHKRIALTLLTAAAPVTLICFVLDAAIAPPLFAVATVIFPVALMAIGAADRGGRLGRAALPILSLLGLLLLVMWGLFQYRGAGSDVPWWGGLPAGAAIQLYGLFVLPFCVTSLGYAWAFERGGLRQGDLDELRRRFPVSRDLDSNDPDSDDREVNDRATGKERL